MKQSILLAAALTGATAQFSLGGTFTVTNTGDSGPGSLRQALLDSQPTGADVIQFNIPGDGPHQIVPLSELPFLNGSVTLDGFTQPGSSPNTLATGMDAQWRIQIGEAGSTAPSLLVCIGGTNVIRGVDFVGGVVGLELSSANDTVIEGCQFRGVGVGIKTRRGWNARIGGTTPGQRNVFVSGTGIQATEATDFLIQGNFFGLRRTPAGPVEGSATGALVLTNSLRGTIGGTQPGAGNQFIGNQTNAALRIIGASGQDLEIRILGNRIGTDFLGSTDVGNLGGGIRLEASGVTVGGVEPGAANVIAHNRGDGVFNVNGQRVAIRGNSIFANVSPPGSVNQFEVPLGIDLGFSSAINANDSGDADAGANLGQNFPVLTLASNSAGGLVLRGTLNSVAAQTFTLDFYGNDECDPSGNGEGQTYFATASVTTDATGNVTFEQTLNIAAPGNFITATATDAAGNTSEFCPCREVTQPAGPPLVAVVTTTADSGAGSLRQAILDVNAAVAAESRRIEFKIPGAGVHTIAPLTELPVITRSVTLDGLSQPGSAANASTNEFRPTLLVRLDGKNLPVESDGLRIESKDCTVQGLIVLRVPGDGIELRGGEGHQVTQSLLGWEVDASGHPLPTAEAILAGSGAARGQRRKRSAQTAEEGGELPAPSLIAVTGTKNVKLGADDQHPFLGLGLLVFPAIFEDHVADVWGVRLREAFGIEIGGVSTHGVGPGVVATDTSGLQVVSSEFTTSGPSPAVTLSGSSGAKIARSKFVDFRSAEPVQPWSRPRIFITSGTSSSNPHVLDGCYFEDASPFTDSPCVAVLNTSGQVPARITVLGCTSRVGFGADTFVDWGKNGWTRNGTSGVTSFPESVVATATAEGTRFTGRIVLTPGRVATIEILTEKTLDDGCILWEPAGTFTVTGNPAGDFEGNIPLPNQLPPGTRVRLTITGPNGNTSELSVPVLVQSAPPAEGAADYGDASDIYKTLAESGGPAHVIKPGIQLGLTVDADADGQPSALAIGDRTDGDGEDEDGVRAKAYRVNLTGGGTDWVLKGSIVAASPGWVLIQADHNRDGVFGSDETLTRNPAGGQAEPLKVFAGPNEFSYSLGNINFVPDANLVGHTGYNSWPIRVRFSTDKDSLLTSTSPDGEVEDHWIEQEDPSNLFRLDSRRTEDGKIILTWANPDAVLQSSPGVGVPFTSEFEAVSPQVRGVDESSVGLWRLLFPPD